MIHALLAAQPVIVAAVAALVGPAVAHPHTYVDQQVQLSLGLDRAEVTVVIVPSIEDGLRS